MGHSIGDGIIVARRALVIALEKSRQLLQPLFAFLGRLRLPGGSHQIQRLAVLLFRQFVEHVAHFVIAAALHRLLAAEHLFDSGAQRLGSIDDKQTFSIRRQPVIPHMDEQAFHGSRVLSRARLDAAADVSL